MGRIVERKRSQEALRESERRLISAQHIAKPGDFTWDIETGKVTWSDAMFEMLRYDRSEKIDYAKVNAEIHHPDDVERVNQWLNDCIASGKDVLTPNEYRLIRKDGEIIHVRVMGVIDRSGSRNLSECTKHCASMPFFLCRSPLDFLLECPSMSSMPSNFRFFSIFFKFF